MIKRSLVSLFLCLCLTLFGCQFSFTTKQLNLGGQVTFNQAGLEGVTIKTLSDESTITDSDGKFQLTAKGQNVTVYAEKEGYFFIPSSIKVSSDTSNIHFEASKDEDLVGQLSLSEVQITPSSIVSLAENFRYEQNGEAGLKIKDFKINFGQNTFTLGIDEFAIKNEPKSLAFEDGDISVSCGEKFMLSFMLSAYYTYSGGSEEFVFEETQKTYLSVQMPQTTKMLRGNQIEYSIKGVNASNSKFSYDVTFVFDYFKAI